MHRRYLRLLSQRCRSARRPARHGACSGLAKIEKKKLERKKSRLEAGLSTSI